MRYLKFADQDGREHAAVTFDNGQASVLDPTFAFLDQLESAIQSRESFLSRLRKAASQKRVDVQELNIAGKLLPPVPGLSTNNCLVTGTGLTHVRSAEIRNSMNRGEANETDSQRIYLSGRQDGKPRDGSVGAQPEWFFKGLGQCIVASGMPLHVPGFSLSAGEEVELAGVYYITSLGTPVRLGFTLANDFSDHKLEEINYLYVAPSKLRQCAMGPELFLGDLSDEVVGSVRIQRGEEVIWEREFRTGEAHMTHTIANLEHHHFKHSTLIKPGDLHVHLFGCPAFSYGDGITLCDGDVIEMTAEGFGEPLINRVRVEPGTVLPVRVKVLQ